MSEFHCFFKMNAIPLSVHTTFFYFKPHSSVDRHLGCSYLLAIVNNAVMNIDVEISTEPMIFILGGWGIHSEVELLNYLVTLCLIFGETTILLSIVAAPFYIPTSKA